MSEAFIGVHVALCSMYTYMYRQHQPGDKQNNRKLEAIFFTPSVKKK